MIRQRGADRRRRREEDPGRLVDTPNGWRDGPHLNPTLGRPPSSDRSSRLCLSLIRLFLNDNALQRPRLGRRTGVPLDRARLHPALLLGGIKQRPLLGTEGRAGGGAVLGAGTFVVGPATFLCRRRAEGDGRGRDGILRELVRLNRLDRVGPGRRRGGGDGLWFW